MAWSKTTIRRVWEKAAIEPGNDPKTWRKDDCGAWIRFLDLGYGGSQYGWEIDLINPDGGDGVENLRALQWENYADKAEDGALKCGVTAFGSKNIRK